MQRYQSQLAVRVSNFVEHHELELLQYVHALFDDIIYMILNNKHGSLM